MFAILGLIGKFLTFIPGLTDLGNKWVTASYDAKVKTFVAKTGASRDVAVAAIAAQAQVAGKWWFVAALMPALAGPFVIWSWKAIAVDKVLCVFLFGVTCSTDPLGTDLMEVYKTIIYSMFGFAAIREFTK